MPVHKFGSQHAILFVKRARRSSMGGRVFVAVVSDPARTADSCRVTRRVLDIALSVATESLPGFQNVQTWLEEPFILIALSLFNPTRNTSPRLAMPKPDPDLMRDDQCNSSQPDAELPRNQEQFINSIMISV